MTKVVAFNPGHGALLRDRGVNQVTAYNKNFVVLMREIAKQIAEREGQVDSDQLREIALKRDIRPRHPNAWGAIFHNKHWLRIGFKQSALASNRTRVIGIWKWIEHEALT